MIIYSLRNDKGQYISMNGTLTTEWLEASKFSEESIEIRLKYTSEDFKLVKFEVKEIFHAVRLSDTNHEGVIGLEFILSKVGGERRRSILDLITTVSNKCEKILWISDELNRKHFKESMSASGINSSLVNYVAFTSFSDEVELAKLISSKSCNQTTTIIIDSCQPVNLKALESMSAIFEKNVYITRQI